MHEARLVGDDDALGDVREGVDFFGQTLTRDWSPVSFSEAELAKAQGNPCVEVREAAEAEAKPLSKDEVILRLFDLGVEHDPKAKVGDLRDLLAKAEQAAAEADAEAEPEADEA